jgi:hypothetical protein
MLRQPAVGHTPNGLWPRPAAQFRTQLFNAARDRGYRGLSSENGHRYLVEKVDRIQQLMAGIPNESDCGHTEYHGVQRECAAFRTLTHHASDTNLFMFECDPILLGQPKLETCQRFQDSNQHQLPDPGDPNSRPRRLPFDVTSPHLAFSYLPPKPGQDSGTDCQPCPDCIPWHRLTALARTHHKPMGKHRVNRERYTRRGPGQRSRRLPRIG